MMRVPTPAVALAALVVGCGPEAAPNTAEIALSTPQALITDCANIPTDLEAELTVSGNRDACPMTVDVGAQSTSGSCTVAPGQIRFLTLDWFVERTLGDETVRVVLAQARGELDLRDAQEAEATWTVSEDDVQTATCVDVREDAVDGSTTQTVNGSNVPVCDLDNSCGGTFTPACTNLGEICDGLDPLDPAD